MFFNAFRRPISKESTPNLRKLGIENVRDFPTHYVETLEHLEESGRLDHLVSAYREVFGEAPWNEGGICNRCKKTLSLADFKERMAQGNLHCECGGDFSDYYPPEQLQARIRRELTPGEGVKPIFVSLEGDEQNPIGGFTWGAIVEDLDKLQRRIIEGKYADPERRELGEEETEQLIRITSQEGVAGPVLFEDELAILKRFRGGVTPIMGLVRALFEHGAKSDCYTHLFWTSERSPIYNLATRFGYKPIYTTSEGLVYLLLKGGKFQYQLLKRLTPEKMRKVLFSREIKGQGH